MFEDNPQKSSKFEARMKSNFLRLRADFLRFYAAKNLRSFEDKTSKNIIFRMRLTEANISDVFGFPSV